MLYKFTLNFEALRDTEHRVIWQIYLFNIFQKARETETYRYGKDIHWKDNPFSPLLINVNIKDLKKHKNLKSDNRLQGKPTNFTKILKYIDFDCRFKSFSPYLTASQKMLWKTFWCLQNLCVKYVRIRVFFDPCFSVLAYEKNKFQRKPVL